MANPWFRLYSEFADDPKVQMLSEAMQRRLIMLFCSRCKGETLHETERAFQWRVTETELAETKAIFLSKGFIDGDWNLLNWNKRQFLSDSSTDRVRRYRQSKKQNETLHETVSTVTVTPPEQNRTDSEQSKSISRAEQDPSVIAKIVLSELSLSGGELLRNLTEVCASELQKFRPSAELQTALVMAWNRYTEMANTGKLEAKFMVGADKFFGQGIWCAEVRWPWKQGCAPQATRNTPKAIEPQMPKLVPPPGMEASDAV
jgi:hypothetical protein